MFFIMVKLKILIKFTELVSIKLKNKPCMGILKFMDITDLLGLGLFCCLFYFFPFTFEQHKSIRFEVLRQK